MTEPYYSDESVTLWHGDAFEFLADTSDESFDCVITDPPFDARTHAMARSECEGAPSGGRLLSGGAAVFQAFTHADQLRLFGELGRVTRGWVVSNVSTDTAFRFETDSAPRGLKVLRVGAWVKTNAMPIFSADRPAMGWEPLLYLHRSDRKPSWHGGGRAANYYLPTSQGSGHPTQKPIGMVTDWVKKFTAPGEVILDPFAGTGTTLRAAVDEGRQAVGVEKDERWCEFIANRLAQGVLDFGGLE